MTVYDCATVQYLQSVVGQRKPVPKTNFQRCRQKKRMVNAGICRLAITSKIKNKTEQKSDIEIKELIME